jgi:hypothetical protein
MREPGITFNAVVDVPENLTGTQLYFAQWKYPQRWQYEPNGNRSPIGIHGWDIDKSIPYPMLSGDGSKFNIVNSKQHDVPLETNDSPGIIRLNALDTNKIEVDGEMFEMYVVWEPVPGNQVPLGMIEWQWSGEAEKDSSAVFGWKKTSGDAKSEKWTCVDTIRQGSTPPGKSSSKFNISRC